MRYLHRGGNGAIGGGRSVDVTKTLVSRVLPVLIAVLTVIVLPTGGNGAIGG